MKTLRTLGGLAGGFLVSLPPGAVLTTLVWLAARSHSAVAVVFVIAIVICRRADHD
ncbi:MAG: hypothetical protein P8Q92_04100 [Pseudoprimorskyibacter sp.]|nr:hypothetical protein [Pseudoprimorskyibacter sp.]